MNVRELIASNPEVRLDIKPVDRVEVGEIISKRTANAKVFGLGGNKRRARIYSCPIHYKDVDGKFKTIDVNVKRKSVLLLIASKYEYGVDSGIYKAHFDKDKPWNYRFEVGDKWVEYEALFEESESLSIDVETSVRGVKETITLLNKNTPTKFRWNIQSNGLNPNPPYAVDANGDFVPVSEALKDNILTYTLDVSKAVYPIILDPSTTIEATNDGAVYNQDISYAATRDDTEGIGAATNRLYVGQTLANYGVYRAFASFAIPAMTACSACNLLLYGHTNGSTTDFNIYIHSSTYVDAPTITDFPLFDGRRTAQADNGTILNDAWNSSGFNLNGWNTITLNASGRADVLGAQGGTLKLCLISKEDYDNSEPADDEYLMFESSRTVNKEPYLDITYTALIPQAVGGVLTLVGALASTICVVQALGGGLTLDGELSGSNPAWLILDDALVWMGEWDETWSYNIDDVVLHKAGDEWHVFVSKIGHNVGNPPNSSAEAWHRLYQEQLL